MTHINPIHLTIRSSPEDGYYHWTMHHGPDGVFEASGSCPLLERCFEEILQAQRALDGTLLGILCP